MANSVAFPDDDLHREGWVLKEPDQVDKDWLILRSHGEVMYLVPNQPVWVKFGGDSGRKKG